MRSRYPGLTCVVGFLGSTAAALAGAYGLSMGPQ